MDFSAKTRSKTIVGTEWVFRNKLDEKDKVFRNKARLVAKDYSQEECINYDETYVLVARLEVICLLLTYASYYSFKLFQISVKCVFLNRFIKEEVFVKQPLNFKDFKFSNHVFNLKKTLYGLKQTSRVW